MARRSQRLSSGSKSTPLLGHKRSASDTAIQSADPKRSKSKMATPTKSQYFQKPAKPDMNNEDDEKDSELSSEDDEEASEFGNESEEISSSGGGDDDNSYQSDDAPKSRKGTKSKPKPAASPAIRTKGNELWRPGVKAGLGPGNQVVIKKPQARPAGKTPYEDETIHPNTFLFLKDLKANNERQWLKSKSVFSSHCLVYFQFDIGTETRLGIPHVQNRSVPNCEPARHGCVRI